MKGQAMGPGSASHRVDASNNIRRHREGGPFAAIEDMASGKTIEIVATLCIASGAQGYSPSVATIKGIVLLLVSMNVGTKLNDAMFVVVKGNTSENGSRAEGWRHTAWTRKKVEPEGACVDKVNEKLVREGPEWKGVVQPAFFEGADVKLDVGNVLIV
jgi:hypothetical protein